LQGGVEEVDQQLLIIDHTFTAPLGAVFIDGTQKQTTGSLLQAITFNLLSDPVFRLDEQRTG
ncbi:hypothetical protein, partial [Pseudomonas sp. FW305-BF6]|uniref:hypothetical protein n=1 Tax=Pseudomonas sp. FW305-BF6 TaxID=2070673 RepID=UPI001C48E286